MLVGLVVVQVLVVEAVGMLTVMMVVVMVTVEAAVAVVTCVAVHLVPVAVARAVSCNVVRIVMVTLCCHVVRIVMTLRIAVSMTMIIASAQIYTMFVIVMMMVVMQAVTLTVRMVMVMPMTMMVVMPMSMAVVMVMLLLLREITNLVRVHSLPARLMILVVIVVRRHYTSIIRQVVMLKQLLIAFFIILFIQLFELQQSIRFERVTPPAQSLPILYFNLCNLLVAFLRRLLVTVDSQFVVIDMMTAVLVPTRVERCNTTTEGDLVTAGIELEFVRCLVFKSSIVTLTVVMIIMCRVVMIVTIVMVLSEAGMMMMVINIVILKLDMIHQVRITLAGPRNIRPLVRQALFSVGIGPVLVIIFFLLDQF